jgi:hypothetical protein
VPGIATEFQLQGTVTEFQSLARLRVRGEWVDLNTAQFAAGSGADVVNGRRLRLTAVAGPGALVATRVAVL